ncbi:MAG: hypothetical protein ACD_52C00300G0006 [uncultured bacterium]|nr:MAG: hypothetical protein ACD_52C00300G0006 [uncultured bacterium]
MSTIFRLIIIWSATLPLVTLNNSYEGPKIVFFLIGGVLLFVFWILFLWSKKVNLKKVDYAFLLWLVIMLASSLMGVHPIDSILGSSYRHQGILFFLVLFVLGKTIEGFSLKLKNLLIKSIIISIVIQSLVVILISPIGTIGEANSVAGFLVIGSTFVQKSRYKIVLLPIILIAIIVTGSRSGLAIFAIVTFTNLIRSKYLVSLAGVGFVLISILGAYLEKNVSAFESRFTIWSLAFKTIRERPLLGFGAETNEVVFGEMFARVNLPLHELIVERSHNLFLDVAIWSGLIGLAAFTLWLVMVAKKIAKHDHVLFIGLVGWLLFAFVQPIGVSHWVILTILTSLPRHFVCRNEFPLYETTTPLQTLPPLHFPKRGLSFWRLFSSRLQGQLNQPNTFL